MAATTSWAEGASDDDAHKDSLDARHAHAGTLARGRDARCATGADVASAGARPFQGAGGRQDADAARADVDEDEARERRGSRRRREARPAARGAEHRLRGW